MLAKEIKEMKEEMEAIIVAHNSQLPLDEKIAENARKAIERMFELT